MAESKKPLREALNLRIDDKLADEIDRIAQLQGKTASEVARTLLRYGAEVERRLEAQKLMRDLDADFSNVAGRIVIKAEFVPYNWQDVAEMREVVDSGHTSSYPTWDDMTP
jgi:hypothetical protein